MSNRQERRKQERISKKESNPAQNKMELKMNLLQPWSVPIMRTELPPYVLDGMIELTDDMIADENTPSHGDSLAGQIKTELTVDIERLKKYNLDKFFDTMIKQFVIYAKTQQTPYDAEIKKETWLTQIVSMWVVSQQPNEYNPLHHHTECQISAVMYLKVPKFLPSEKEHRQHDDGSITFISNAEGSLDPYDDLDMSRFEDAVYVATITNQQVLTDLANWGLLLNQLLGPPNTDNIRRLEIDDVNATVAVDANNDGITDQIGGVDVFETIKKKQVTITIRQGSIEERFRRLFLAGV